MSEGSRNAQLLDCRFQEANLRGATFNGALMKWTEVPPEETGYWEEMQDGERDWVRNYLPPFWRADLKVASFENVAFRNADFREAENLRRNAFSLALPASTIAFSIVTRSSSRFFTAPRG